MRTCNKCNKEFDSWPRYVYLGNDYCEDCWDVKGNIPKSGGGE